MSTTVELSAGSMSCGLEFQEIVYRRTADHAVFFPVFNVACTRQKNVVPTVCGSVNVKLRLEVVYSCGPTKSGASSIWIRYVVAPRTLLQENTAGCPGNARVAPSAGDFWVGAVLARATGASDSTPARARTTTPMALLRPNLPPGPLSPGRNPRRRKEAPSDATSPGMPEPFRISRMAATPIDVVPGSDSLPGHGHATARVEGPAHAPRDRGAGPGSRRPGRPTAPGRRARGDPGRGRSPGRGRVPGRPHRRALPHPVGRPRRGPIDARSGRASPRGSVGAPERAARGAAHGSTRGAHRTEHLRDDRRAADHRPLGRREQDARRRHVAPVPGPGHPARSETAGDGSRTPPPAGQARGVGQRPEPLVAGNAQDDRAHHQVRRRGGAQGDPHLPGRGGRGARPDPDERG